MAGYRLPSSNTLAPLCLYLHEVEN